MLEKQLQHRMDKLMLCAVVWDDQYTLRAGEWVDRSCWVSKCKVPTRTNHTKSWGFRGMVCKASPSCMVLDTRSRRAWGWGTIACSVSSNTHCEFD